LNTSENFQSPNNTNQSRKSKETKERKPLLDEEDKPKEQKLNLVDIYLMFILAANHMIAQWMAYMVIYSNPGDTPFTSLEVDLGLSETEYGILSGFTFALINAIFAIFSGVLVDKYSRKWILVIAGVLWSLLTITQSFTTSFLTIIFPRILMEIATTA